MARLRACLFGVILVLSSCCLFLLASGQITHPSEVASLLAVRRKLNDPLKNLNWTKTKDPCLTNWTGVICNFLDPSDGYLHVQELRLLNMNLTGRLAPELGQLTHMVILDFLWNSLWGSIPKEIGNITALQLLLLSGNQISGPLPDELGYLPNLTKFQLDLNQISGPLPKSFANLPRIQHFHMNNNLFSGQIPPELSALPLLIHFLMDNNNLSGYLPPELSKMPKLKILQLDNNNFEGSEIPDSYANMSKLVKLSLRNCNLQGPVPDLSNIPSLLFVDLSQNQLTGSIPTNKLTDNITTIDLSNNMLNGSIPSNFSGLPNLQRLSLENNFLTGSVPSNIWQNMTFSAAATVTLDFQNNSISDITGSLVPPSNLTIKLQGNPVCTKSKELKIVQFCGPEVENNEVPESSSNSSDSCRLQSCPLSGNYEYVPGSPVDCFCAAPLGVGLRLRSPSISDFIPYEKQFLAFITSYAHVDLYQLYIDSFIWEKGPRLKMFLKFFPKYSNYSNSYSDQFNTSEILRIRNVFAAFTIPGNDTFGPYDLLNFTLKGPYSNVLLPQLESGMSKGVLAGIVLGAISCAIAICLVTGVIFLKIKPLKPHAVSKIKSSPKIPIKVDGVKGFNFGELDIATSSFNITTQVGQGGYGKVYKGILADGTVVAIKRAQQGSLQGQREFFTEIELLSRLHHRNLVSLVGYCDEEGEQMLVYEFLPNGSLHDLLSARYTEPLNFATRLHIALGSAKGILYLHTEADPPIIHRDIKANNILLDSKFTPKVSDFGISKLVPRADVEGNTTALVSTAVRGTPGYVDPEYFLTHKLTEKSDVYSLGVVFLELLTGRQPISHGRNIVREVNAACQSGMMFSIIDKGMGPYPSECVKKFMAMALKCCQEEAEGRPSMLEVVRELESMSSTVPEISTRRSDSDASTSGMSWSDPSLVYSRRNSTVTSDSLGSNLVSGVFPDIRPR